MVAGILKASSSKDDPVDSEGEAETSNGSVKKRLFGRRLSRRGSNASESTELTEANTIVKEVTFNLEQNQVFRIKPLCRSEEDKEKFFWVREVLKESKREGKQLTTSDDKAKAYIRAFDSAFRQVHTERKLGSDTLKEIVVGISNGFRGLEQHTCPSSMRRKKMMKEHVLSVVSCYQDEIFGSSTFSIGSMGSSHTALSVSSAGTTRTHSSASASGKSPCKTLRAHASKLSAGNRHFAAAIGKADHMAVSNEESLETGSTIAASSRRESLPGASPASSAQIVSSKEQDQNRGASV